MSSQNTSVWDALLNAKLVTGEPLTAETAESPWYVKVLLAVSGWFAALFLLGSIAFAFGALLDKPSIGFTFGLIMIGGAYLLLVKTQYDFLEHLALAISLAGQAIVAIVIFKEIPDELSFFLLTCFHLLLTLFIPNFIHRVLSSFFMALCFAYGLAEIEVPFISSGIIMALLAVVTLKEFKDPQHLKKYTAISYGLVTALLYAKGSELPGMGYTYWFTNEGLLLSYLPWIGEVLLGLVTLGILWVVLHRLGYTSTSPVYLTVIGGAIVLCAVSLEAQGITIGISLILLGFAQSNIILKSVGIIALLFFISSYYYLLDNTLMEKAQTLFLVGVVLLATRWLLLKSLQLGKEH